MGLSNPIVNFQIKPAYEKVQNAAQKILVISQMTSAGTATANTIVESVGNANEQDTLFGADSMAATAVRAFKRVNKLNRVDVLPLDDGAAAVASTADFVFAGTATANGTLFVSVGSKINNTYELTIASSDTATDVGDLLAALITADTTAVVDAANVTGTVTFTAVNKGATGNQIGISASGTVAGITYTVNPMASGVGEPDEITDGTAFDAIPTDVRYQTIIYPQSYDKAANYLKLRTFLDERFVANNRILDGQALIGIEDTLSNLKTLATAVDNKNISLYANNIVDDTFIQSSAIFELDYVIASYFGAIRALRLTTGAQIGQYIVGATGAADDIGGTPLASLPYMNTPFTDILPIAEPKYFWTDQEVEELLVAGVGVIGNNQANSNVIAGQIPTTYLKDDAGNDDKTFKYLNYYDTLVNIREYFVDNLKARFVQSRLAEGDLAPYRNEANKHVVVSALLNSYQDLVGLVLVEKGKDALRFFTNNLVVTLTKADGKVTVFMKIVPVTQLREVDAVMQVSFSINI